MSITVRLAAAVGGVMVLGAGALVGAAVLRDSDVELRGASATTAPTPETTAAVTTAAPPDDEVTTTVATADDASSSTTPAPSTSAPAPAPPTGEAPPATTVPATATTAPSTTAPATTTSTTAPAPPYRSSTSTVTAAQLGSSYTPGRGCAEPGALRMITLTHWGYDGAVHEGRIVVAASRAAGVDGVFRQLYANRFPIERMVPIDAYGGDDQASMRANNTSGYNCRTVAGTDRLSNHAFGEAIDVNPLVNPYVRGNTVDPPEGRPWADRSRRDPGMIHADDPTVRAFAAAGWKWGGYWSSGKDYQHFSTSGT